MKTREVLTVTNNEDYVRMRIYGGDLPVDEALQELLRLEKSQHEATRQRLREAQSALVSAWRVIAEK